MIEYTPVDPLCLHPDTFELVHREYFWRKDDHPFCTPIQQIYNTLRHCAPDMRAAVAEVQQGTKQLLADMRVYPDEAWKMAQALPHIEDFCECVQETSAKLHNGEPDRRASIEALNRLWAESQQREEEQRQRWLAEVTAGDAHFGGPGAYQQTRDEYYAELDMKKREALRQRIRAFQDAYHQGEQPAQPQRELEPVQAGLWEVPA